MCYISIFLEKRNKALKWLFVRWQSSAFSFNANKSFGNSLELNYNAKNKAKLLATKAFGYTADYYTHRTNIRTVHKFLHISGELLNKANKTWQNNSANYLYVHMNTYIRGILWIVKLRMNLNISIFTQITTNLNPHYKHNVAVTETALTDIYEFIKYTSIYITYYLLRIFLFNGNKTKYFYSLLKTHL